MRFNRGDFLVLLSAMCFAVQIILISRMNSNANAVCIATIQFAVVGLFSFLFAFFLEKVPVWVNIPHACRAVLIFLAVFATAFAFIVQVLTPKSDDSRATGHNHDR
ncbi:MAG: EamA family transporter [Negativicutes bacterium]|nr:EamA family transporter [Negativicutes bacterium]